MARKGKHDIVDEDTLTSILATDGAAASYTQKITVDRTVFTVDGCKLPGIGHTSHREYIWTFLLGDGAADVAGEWQFQGVMLRRQTALGGQFIDAVEFLGSTDLPTPPQPIEHAVDENVAKPHSKVATDWDKANAKEIADKRRAILKRKREAQDKRDYERSVKGRMEKSRLHACCHTPGGESFCTRSFFTARGVQNHINNGIHTGGVWRPYGNSTTLATKDGGQRTRFSKDAVASSSLGQRLNSAFAESSAQNPLLGDANLGHSTTRDVTWDGSVDLVMNGGKFFLPRAPAGCARFTNVLNPTPRSVEIYDILIACHSRCPKQLDSDANDEQMEADVESNTKDPIPSQKKKMNHWTASTIMAKACTAEGVKAVAADYPDLELFTVAAAENRALLPSRLEILEPREIKPYFSSPLSELEKKRSNLATALEKRAAKAVLEASQAAAKAITLTRSGSLKKGGLILEAKQRLEGQKRGKVTKPMREVIMELTWRAAGKTSQEIKSGVTKVTADDLYNGIYANAASPAVPDCDSFLKTLHGDFSMAMGSHEDTSYANFLRLAEATAGTVKRKREGQLNVEA